MPGESPIAISMGTTVMQQNMPFVWKHPDKPYHVTDAKKLRITCPMKYRRYCDRVENNVPVFRDAVTFGPRTKSGAAPFFGLPAEASGAPSAPGAGGAQEANEAPAQPDADEVPGHHPVVPVVDEPEGEGKTHLSSSGACPRQSCSAKLLPRSIS